jgi:aminopeptidase YwaD
VLVDRGTIHFVEKARNAAAAGAAALIVANSEVDVLSGTLGEAGPAIPVLGISRADGQRLKGLLEEGNVSAVVRFEGGIEDKESFNVIGRSPGRSCRVVAGGHYDTVPGAPGGSDNASGTAAIIELARVTALRGNPHAACFVAFSAEEIGLVGSAHFVAQLSPEERNALTYMLNFDMVGFGTGWRLIGTPSLQRQGQAIAEAFGVIATATRLSGSSSDHASFIEAGIPALMLHRVEDTLLHTPADVASRISPEQLAEAVRLGLAFLDGLAPA